MWRRRRKRDDIWKVKRRRGMMRSRTRRNRKTISTIQVLTIRTIIT